MTAQAASELNWKNPIGNLGKSKKAKENKERRKDVDADDSCYCRTHDITVNTGVLLNVILSPGGIPGSGSYEP